MFEDDKQKVLVAYSDLFDKAADPEALAKALVSPTRQAVNVARAYDANTAREADPDEYPQYLQVIDDIAREPAVVTAVTGVTPNPEAKSELLSELGIDDGYTDDDAVNELMDEFAMEAEIANRRTRKLSVGRLILFLIFAIPIGILCVLLMLFFCGLFLCLTAATGALGFFTVSAALNSGFDIIADFIVVGGGAIILLALALLFLWTALWFLFGGLPGVIGGIASLGRSWCYKEVVK